MEWLGWAFAAATALLLTIFIFLYLHQKQQAQHQHKKSQKALGKLENEMNRMQKELHHERDIIGLIQEHMVEGILILDDSDKIQLANRTATALLNISKESWDNKSIFILTNNQDFLDALRKSKTAPQHELLPEDSELHKGCSVRQLLKIDGKYIAIIHPSVAYDLRSSEAWIEAHKYAGLTELFTGEIGELHGVRFIETTEAKVFNGEGCPVKTAADESNGTPAEYYSVYATLFLGKDAYGMIDPEGGNMEMIIKDKGQVGGPLNQFSTLGYKFSSAAKILYQDRMVRVESCGAYSAEDEAN